MTEKEIDLLASLLPQNNIIYRPSGRLVSAIGGGPPKESEPSRVAWLTPSYDYVALYNCDLDDFGIVLPIPNPYEPKNEVEGQEVPVGRSGNSG